MEIVVFLFWVSLFTLFYGHVGYGLLIFLLSPFLFFFRRFSREEIRAEQPAITIIVTAYNEEKILTKKIENTLAINYPEDKLKIIFITDGSTDNSVQLISQHSTIVLLHQTERKGKYAAIKRAMGQVQTPIVVFSDANSMLNKDCITYIVKQYKNPVIGGVAGEKKILHTTYASAVSKAEGFYWQYESLMKRADAAFGTVVGAAGELFSIRTSLFKELDDEIILDDFIISMQVCLQGYKIAYEPKAFAMEESSTSLKEEAKRKIRIAAGAYQAIGYLKNALNFLKHPLLSFQYISRRVFRWVLCPPMLIVLFLTNAVIVIAGSYHQFYNWLLLLQVLFYLFAITGWLIMRGGKQPGLLSIPFYFMFMNYCLVRGWIVFLQGRQTVLWEKSVRETSI